MTRFGIAVLTLLLVLAAQLSGQTNPVPFVNQPLIPATVTPGSPAFTLTVRGTGFVAGSVVNWNGSPRTTTFVSSSQLTATIEASDVAVAQTGTITVVSPSPGGGASNPVFFDVTNPFRQITFSTTAFSSLEYPVWMVTGDLNGDGNLDLITADENGGDISIFFGKGDGTFEPEKDIQLISGADVGFVAVADLNGDGKLDLVASVFTNSSSQAAVLFGNGDGTFGPPSFYPGNLGTTVVGDFNRDGFLDLAFVDWKTGLLSILPGNGAGGFGAEISSNSYVPEAFFSVAGDFNNDGKLDIIATSPNDAYISVALGNGDGTFGPVVLMQGGVNPYGIVAADFNGDGKLDFAVTSNNDAQTNPVSVFLGNGDGTFQPAVQYPVGVSPARISAEDFDGDGILDLIVLNSSAGLPTISVLYGNGDGTFQPQASFPTTANALLTVGDFNNDGRFDLATSNGYYEQMAAMIQIPSVNLSPTSLSFPNQVVGTNSASQTVTLTNASNVPLQISSIAIAGTNSKEFTQTNTCPATLNPGANCQISVVYAPRLVETDSATLTVKDSGAPNTQTVALSGNSIGPVVVLSKKYLAFGNQVIATVSASQVVTLANTGTIPLTISTLVATGDFTQTNNCGKSIAVGGSCSISVRFKPTVIGSRTGAVTINDNAGPPTQIIQLFGIGTDVALSTTSLVFPPQQVGTTSQPDSVRLTNVGNSSLSISGFAMGGPSRTDFGQTNDCGGSLAVGGSCTIEVTFTPSAKSIRNASLEISDNGGGSPQKVTLTGTGD